MEMSVRIETKNFSNLPKETGFKLYSNKATGSHLYLSKERLLPNQGLAIEITEMICAIALTLFSLGLAALSQSVWDRLKQARYLGKKEVVISIDYISKASSQETVIPINQFRWKDLDSICNRLFEKTRREICTVSSWKLSETSSDLLKSDKSFVVEASKSDHSLLLYADKSLYSDKEYLSALLNSVKTTGNLKSVPKDFQEDLDFWEKIIGECPDPTALQHMPENFQDFTKKNVCTWWEKIVKINPKAIKYLPTKAEHFQHALFVEMLHVMLKTNGSLIGDLLKKENQDQIGYVIYVESLKNPCILDHVQKSFRENNYIRNAYVHRSKVY